MSNGKRRPPGFGGLDGVGGTSLCAVLTVLVGACQGGAVDGTAGPMGAGDSNGAPAFAPAESVLPRLTDDQYRNAMVDLFGDPIPNVSLEADTQPHLFSTIGASLTTISENGVGSWEQAALDITAAVFGDGPRRTALLGCEPVGAGDTCTRDFLERFGFRAWRRPLEQEELTRYVDVARRTANGDPWAGVRYATAGMLTSPFFLYRVELGEIDPERTTRRRYTSYEMASRLALFLWGTIPDELLLRAAANDDLVTEAGVREQAERMIADKARLRAAFKHFFAEYLSLNKLDALDRDATLFPTATPALGVAMRTEVERLFERVLIDEDTDFHEVFTARHTTVNSELAALYGVDAPGATDASTWVDVELPVDGPRAGLMTTAGILSIASHVDRSSPTRRGQFVRERLLCEFVPPPPMNFSLDIEQGAVRPDATVREKLEVHRTNPACAGCHAAIDPIGLGLEDFDAIGAFRTTEITASGDRPVDASGALDGEDFLGGRALGELLATDPRTSSCFVKQLYRNASARLEEPGEDAVIRDLVDRFEASGSRLSTLLVDLVASDGFRYLRAQEGANTQSGGNAP